MLAWLGVLAIPACNPPRTSAREECGITERVPYGWAEKLSDRCITRLADDVGLDWSSFGVQPSDLSQHGSTVAAMVVEGLYTIAASDTGPGSALSREPTPSPLRAEFLAQPTVDASDFWYEMISRRIDHMELTTDVPPQDHLMSYDPANARVNVSDLTKLTNSDPAAPAMLPPLYTAAVLVHEAAHAFTKPHSPDSDSLDLYNNGANGVEAIWLYGWIEANAETVSAVDLGSACRLLEGKCTRIAVPSYPCDQLPIVCITDESPQTARHP